jgi:hypothetical protein
MIAWEIRGCGVKKDYNYFSIKFKNMNENMVLFPGIEFALKNK